MAKTKVEEITNDVVEIIEEGAQRVAVGIEEAAQRLGIAIETLLYVAERGDFEVVRDGEGNITGVHL